MCGDEAPFGIVRASDSSAGGGGVDRTRRMVENRGSLKVCAGQLVMAHSSGAGVQIHDFTRPVIAVAVSDIEPLFAGDIQLTGVLTLPDWTTAAGTRELQGVYFGDPARPGGMTTVAPTRGGHTVQVVGYGQGDTLQVAIDQPILL